MQVQINETAARVLTRHGITAEFKPRRWKTSLYKFIHDNSDEPEMILELCSKGMVMVGGGAAPAFFIQLTH